MIDPYTIAKIKVDSNGLSKDTYCYKLTLAVDLQIKDEIIDSYKEDFVWRLRHNECNVTEDDIQVKVDCVAHSLIFVLFMKYIPCKSLVNSLELDTIYSKSLDQIQYTSDGSERYRYAGVNPRLNVCVYVLDKD
jgi:hypothetical protein